MNRLDHVRRFLTDGLADQQVAITWVPAERWGWDSFRRGAGEHHAMGFTPVMPRQGTLLAFVCPEVLVERTRHLSEAAFVDFLTSVRAHLQLHLAQLGLDMPDDLVEMSVLAAQRELIEVDFDLYETIALGAQ